METASAAKQPKKRHSRSKRRKLVNNVDLGNMEEDTPSDLANGNEQAELKSARSLDIGNTKENMPSYLVNGNEQTNPKSVINLDIMNMEEKMPSDFAIGNEKTEPKSTNILDLENMETNTPSDLANGNEQTEPNTAPLEAASADKQPKRRRSRSRMQKSANNLDLGNVEESTPSVLPSGNDEQTEHKPPNKLDYGKMEESLPSNLATGDGQPDPNTALVEAVSAANQPEKKRPRSKKHKSANNLDLGSMEEKKPCDLANGNEQGDPNIAPEEADSAPKQPKKKHSRSKKRKLANNLELGNNMEENMPSTNGIEQNNLNNALTEVASMAEQQKDEVQTEPESGNKSDLIEEKVIRSDHVKGNEQSDPNTGPTEAAA